MDILWNENIGPISFAHPYVEVVFEKELYDEIEGVRVAPPEVILSMKFLIEKNKYRGQKQIKDLVDIYVLAVAPEELDFEVFKLLYSKEKFDVNWVAQYFGENEEFLASVVRERLGLMFEREEFLFIINELKEILNK